MEKDYNIIPEEEPQEPNVTDTPPVYQSEGQQATTPNAPFNNFNNNYQPNTMQGNGMPPNNNLPLAIVATVLGCCGTYCTGFILGIIAIVFSSQVNSKYAMGDVIGAQKAAKTSKTLSLVALGLFVVGIIWSIIQIQMMGGIDAYIESIKSMMELYQ